MEKRGTDHEGWGPAGADVSVSFMAACDLKPRVQQAMRWRPVRSSRKKFRTDQLRLQTHISGCTAALTARKQPYP